MVNIPFQNLYIQPMAFNLFSLIARDHQKRAESYDREGKKRQAAEEYAKAGDYRRAATLAFEIQDEPKLIHFSLFGALGKIPPRAAELNARQAGDLLATSGHYDWAIPLFEMANDMRRAAAAALKLRDSGRAARFYEKSRLWTEAVSHYEKASLFEDALRVLELEAKTLSRTRGEPSARLQEVNLKRAEVLLQLGRSTAAVTLLMQQPPSLRRAELLERSGRNTEAIEAYLGAGESDRALLLARKSPDQARRVAQVHLHSGRPVLAGEIFARLGMVRDAAEAYEAAQDWWQAAYRWETVQEPARAAEAYRKAGKVTDAARCFVTAGQPLQAAELYIRSGNLAAAAALHTQTGDLAGAIALYLDANDVEQAAMTLQKIPPEELGYITGALLLAPWLVEAGRSGEALRFLGKAPAADPRRRGEDGTVLDRLYWEGRALEGLDQAEPARKRYAKLLQLNPTYRDVAERKSRLEAQPEPAAAEAAPLAARSLDGLAVGQRLANRYDILGELGRGGMGRVYRARDLDLGEPVAIKTLLTPSEGSAANDDEERLLRELQICRRVSHPNVVRVFDLGRFEGGIFITMELLEGQMLEELIVKDQPIPLERIRFFLSEIAAGLQEAHSLGIVHRDLKPSNVIVTERRLKILDFGIARMTGFDNRLTRTGFAFGSPMYMSPEQLLGQQLDGRSDLYALGILAYALIGGREPFSDDNPAVLALMHLRDEIPDIRQLRPDLPNPWIGFIARLLAKEPDQRYASAQEVLAVLPTLPVG
jgi:tetratricopeptide (TPR) repeat protein